MPATTKYWIRLRSLKYGKNTWQECTYWEYVKYRGNSKYETKSTTD